MSNQVLKVQQQMSLITAVYQKQSYTKDQTDVSKLFKQGASKDKDQSTLDKTLESSKPTSD